MSDKSSDPIVKPHVDDQAADKNENEVAKKDEWGELFRTAGLAILLALLIRTFLFEPFNIPSGSMVPNLLIGDYLFVSKYSYGYSKYSFPFGLGGFDGRIMSEDLPERGDVAVFKLPANPSIDYIKRVIGLPGDTVQMKNGRLYINGQMVAREKLGDEEYDNGGGYISKATAYLETLPNGVLHTIYEEDDYQPLDNTPLFKVPEGHYFMMGDNRDNSRDSRVPEEVNGVGFVPAENFIGRAQFLFFSTNGRARIYEIWKWPSSIRWSRLFNGISNGAPEKEVEARAK
ncbi:MAG: signal peptidase I [Pseudobdellovibrionaceae bacterium]